MKVLTAEMVPGNKRERITGGVYIEFYSDENVQKGDCFKVNVGDSIYEFTASGIKVDDDSLRITAIEVGYWASKMDHKGIDLRKAIGAEITMVIDEEEKKEINTRSCWC